MFQKHYLSAFFLFFGIVAAHSQIGSTCNISTNIENFYKEDATRLAIQRMYQNGSPDTAFVLVPDAQIDSILSVFAAIYNADGTLFPTRDSVIDDYCVHANESHYGFSLNQFMVYVDTTQAWVMQWAALQQTTGYNAIDSLMLLYGLQVQDFLHFHSFSPPFTHCAILRSNQPLNAYALKRVLESVSGVYLLESDLLIGGAGDIHYTEINDTFFVDFKYEWSDCFDGCDNIYTWHTKVYPDCSVEFLGSENIGFFGQQPLPVPPCVGVGIVEIPEKLEVFTVYPNPTNDVFSIYNADKTAMQVELYATNGQLLLQHNFAEHSYPEISLADFPAGVFWLRIRSGNRLSVQKIIKTTR